VLQDYFPALQHEARSPAQPAAFQENRRWLSSLGWEMVKTVRLAVGEELFITLLKGRCILADFFRPDLRGSWIVEC